MTFVLFGLLSSGSFLLKSAPTRKGSNALQALLLLLSRLPPVRKLLREFRALGLLLLLLPLGGQEKQGGLRGAPGVVLSGAPSPPARPRSSERGGSASGLASGMGGLAPSSPSGGGGAGVARSRQTSLSRVSESVDFPQFSPHVPRRENSRESSVSCSRVLSSRDSRSSGRGSRKDKRARSREGSSRGRRHRSRSSSRSRSRGRERGRRHALLVVAHAVSGRGLLTATALGRIVTGLDPRIGIGHAMTALDVSGCGLLTATAPAVSVRVPLPVGGSGAIVRDRTLSRIARVTARGQACDYLLLLPACDPRKQDDWPDVEPRRVWRRLPLSLLWLLERRRVLLLLQEGHP